ncbi:MAG: SH3 domain-containing protein, partial [Acetatifactor sp.]|nr:SH3 domain-containing protein [Acetatifactor sp.]
MKKIVPVIVALVLILIIGGVAVGSMLVDKYSYSRETADLAEYYGVTGDRLAIALQDEIVPEQAVRRDGVCYFDLDTIHTYFNEGFYVDLQEQLLLYTTAVDTYRVAIGSGSWQNGTESGDMGYAICFAEGETIYMAADYLKMFTNFSYEVHNDLCMQVYTEWGTRELAEVTRDTQVRSLGGIKSPILRQLAKGETVEILEQMETWSEVKTSDSIIGYVENKRLSEITTETEAPVTDYVPEEYTSLSMTGKVS